jgi:hypothetical protein
MESKTIQDVVMNELRFRNWYLTKPEAISRFLPRTGFMSKKELKTIFSVKFTVSLCISKDKKGDKPCHIQKFRMPF